MTPAEELKRKAEDALARGDASTFADAFVLVARRHPDLYQRYKVSPQQPIIKAADPINYTTYSRCLEWADARMTVRKLASLEEGLKSLMEEERPAGMFAQAYRRYTQSRG